MIVQWTGNRLIESRSPPSHLQRLFLLDTECTSQKKVVEISSSVTSLLIEGNRGDCFVFHDDECQSGLGSGITNNVECFFVFRFYVILITKIKFHVLLY